MFDYRCFGIISTMSENCCDMCMLQRSEKNSNYFLFLALKKTGEIFLCFLEKKCEACTRGDSQNAPLLVYTTDLDMLPLFSVF